MLDTYDNYKTLINSIQKNDLHGVGKCIERLKAGSGPEQFTKSLINFTGKMLHNFALEKTPVEQVSSAARTLFTSLQNQPLDFLAKVRLLSDFAPRIHVHVLRTFFDEGKPFHLDKESLRDFDEWFFGLGFRIGAQAHGLEESIKYAIDTLCGWDDFDAYILRTAFNPRHHLICRLALENQDYAQMLAKLPYSFPREHLDHPALLEFAISNDKIDLSNLGYMLARIVDDQRGDLMDGALAQVVRRISSNRMEDPVRNFKALQLYINVHCKRCEISEMLLDNLHRECRKAERDQSQLCAP